MAGSTCVHITHTTKYHTQQLEAFPAMLEMYGALSGFTKAQHSDNSVYIWGKQDSHRWVENDNDITVWNNLGK